MIDLIDKENSRIFYCGLCFGICIGLFIGLAVLVFFVTLLYYLGLI